jgi:predicted ribosome quality control (RQC) complex YloA/Tae2 family protein
VNHAELTAVVEELRGLLGCPLSSVTQPARDRVIVGIGARHVAIVPRGPHARVHLTDVRHRSPARPFSFQGACRAHLGGQLVAVELDPADRVVDLRFGRLRLHLRMIGVRGGLWLVGDDRVIAAYDGPAPPALPPLGRPPTAPPSARAIRFPVAAGQSVSEAAEAWFGEREALARLRERRVATEKRLKAQVARDRRLLDGLGRDLVRADEAPALRRRADALAAGLHQVRRGQASVEVQAIDGTDDRVTVPLDPAKSPGGNLDDAYRRVRRLERMGDRVLERIEAVEARLRTLTAALAVVSDAPPALLAKLEDLVPGGPPRAAASAPHAPWVTWLTDRDQEVLVGRDALSNRKLTFQKARRTDWWMHLRGQPAAHVVIRCSPNRPPDLETLLGAAQIVGLHARIPVGAPYDVQVARASSVRSIPGAPDGRVLVHDERVLRVTREPSPPAGWRRADAELPTDLDAIQELIE